MVKRPLAKWKSEGPIPFTRSKKMTHEIKLEIMADEHATKQPSDKRYALYCQVGYYGYSDESCETARRSGWMGNSADYAQVKEVGIAHPHAVLIRFYQDFGNTQPTEEFLEDQKNQNQAKI